ncbi:uncharacterized protein C15orf39 homolog [Spea bombifrons]|uniref:uncharacterized protein C15orf39 homolog n=1 Tax=Spea bombifrons TaxID=233779 RepID=UPI00234BF220|nr:uncharacterized protein C15orf39 homolog [Spea bombifrons]
MAGKRQTNDLDHMSFGKLPRVEVEAQNCSLTFPGKTSHEEMLAYSSVMACSLPAPERHTTPWSSASSYLLCADSAPSQHLQTEETSARCNRPEIERLNNHAQLREIPGNHLMIQPHHQIMRYSMPSTQGYPPLVMPRPVYRSPSNFVDAGYGTHRPPLGFPVGSPIRTHAVEWNSTNLAYPSVCATGGNKKLPPTRIGPPEHVKSPHVLSQGMKELSPALRHRGDTRISGSQGEPFREHYGLFAQPSTSLHHSQFDASIGWQRGSAFSPLTPARHTYLSSAFQDSMDNGLGNFQGMNYYSPTGAGYSHRPSSYNYSMDTTLLPPIARTLLTHSNGELIQSPAYKNRDRRVSLPNRRMNDTNADRMLQLETPNLDQRSCSVQMDKDVRVASSQADQDLQVGLARISKSPRVQYSHLDRNVCMVSSKEGNGLALGLSQSGREQQVGDVLGDPLMQKIVQSPPPSTVFTDGHLHYSKTSIPSQMHAVSDSHSTHIQQSDVDGENVRHSPSTPTNISGDQISISHENQRLTPQESAMSSTNSACHSTPPATEVNINGPHSPPMPVINDVFSLAPYRDYLEGTAPHPFPLLKENIAKHKALYSQPAPQKTKEVGKGSDESLQLNSVSEHLTPSDINLTTNIQEKDLKQAEGAVLDLSLKKSPNPSLSPNGQKKCQHHDSMDSPSQFPKAGYTEATAGYLFEQPIQTISDRLSHPSKGSPLQTNAQTGADCLSTTAISYPSQTSMQTTRYCHTQTANRCSPGACLPPSVFACPIQPPTKYATQTMFPLQVAPPSNPNVPLLTPKGLSHRSTPLQTQFLEHRKERTIYPKDSPHLLSLTTEQDNEANGFHSSKSFMFRKYKLMKLPFSGGETQTAENNSDSHVLTSPFQLLSESVQSLPPSAPESSPTLGEANVSLASGEETAGSGHHFTELHRSVRVAISNSVGSSPPGLLQDWQLKSKEDERPKSPMKSKMSSRSSEPSQDHEIWLAIDGVRMLLHKVLSQLETFMFTRRCPFPHVIRAGAIFIPIYLVKEVLFSELLGPSVDRVLQRHKVELRPTTLSEEKLLRDTELKNCPSRMLKLLALKQLPDVYPDLLHLYWGYCIQKQLDNKLCVGLRVEKECPPKRKLKHASLDGGNVKVASFQREDTSVSKLHRASKRRGKQVYETQKRNPSQVRGGVIKKKRQVVHKKVGVGKRTKFTYRRKGPRKKLSGKGFPDLVGRRILHLFDDGEQEAWFRGRVLQVHRRSSNPLDTQYEVWYDDEPGTRYFLELLQDYEKGWLRFETSAVKQD